MTAGTYTGKIITGRLSCPSKLNYSIPGYFTTVLLDIYDQKWGDIFADNEYNITDQITFTISFSVFIWIFFLLIG